jgi:hypothetical protein
MAQQNGLGAVQEGSLVEPAAAHGERLGVGSQTACSRLARCHGSLLPNGLQLTC